MSSELVRQLIENDPFPAWLGSEHAWRRVYGRTSGKAAAVLVYEPETGPSDAVCITIGLNGESWLEGIGNVDADVWLNDRSLPALSQLAKRATTRFEPVRYRPGKRCTLRSTGKRPMFVKCLADQRGAAINQDARLLYSAASKGWLDFGVARPAGWIESSRLLVQHAVPGSPIVNPLSGSGGQALAARLGRANASLVRAPLSPPSRFTYTDQMARTRKYAQRLSKHVPEAVGFLDRLLDRLAAVTPGNADRPIHGAPHAHQWLDGPDGLMLVDFDRFGRGDPELDVATFLAEADFEEGQSQSAGDAYLAAFRELWPVDAALLAAYRVHKHIAKSLRMATAIRTDAKPRAMSILRRAPMLLGDRRP